MHTIYEGEDVFEIEDNVQTADSEKTANSTPVEISAILEKATAELEKLDVRFSDDIEG
ncbi:MAG TPA: hypothetical protein PLQ36_02560 [Candidatus Gracilibacteria bacterium]|nr:hypothetical protein [Candidatus Gracilibacteria bacterium]